MNVRVWAPNAGRVRLVVAEAGRLGEGPRWTYELSPEDGGWYGVEAEAAVVGRDYGFLLDEDEELLADPRSRRQPEGVHGPSRFWRDEAAWHDAAWSGLPLAGAVFYELHIGTFTAAGTLDAAIDHLDHLVALGVTHVELLPVNAVNGIWNWGYDGVLWYAVHEPYGGPDALHRFVDACHEIGLAVCLDVVYNHLGASGNVMPRFAPYLKDGANTWGSLINLDGEHSEGVRAHILDNARMWLTEFHLDALRLDAVHALVDGSPRHLLAELSEAVRDLEAKLGRTLVLVAESDLNDPVTFTPTTEGGWGLDGQWDDDVHHALHALVTGERQGYYRDFGTLSCLAKVSTRAFFHDGTHSSFRGRRHGRPVPRDVPGWRFVAFLQNHDQVGNRAAGERISMLAEADRVALGALLLFTSPFTPLVFMGEEWAASTPWPFFTSHPEPELAAAVGPGRIEEFAAHGWDVSAMPDPQDPATFSSAKLHWEEAREAGHATMLARYRELIALRHRLPELALAPLSSVDVRFDEEQCWILIGRGRDLVVAANFADEDRLVPLVATDVLYARGVVELGPQAVRLGPLAGAVLRRS